MRFVLYPGYVNSKNDGQRHHIGSADLVRLYRVDRKQCVVAGTPGYMPKAGDVHLFPQYDGDYTIPQASAAA